MKTGITSLILQNLVGIAAFLLKSNKLEQAAELLGYVINHPANGQAIQKLMEPTFDELKAIIRPEILTVAIARGKTKELQSIAEEIFGCAPEKLRHG